MTDGVRASGRWWPPPAPAHHAAGTPHVWARKRPIGYPKTVATLGGIAAPLIAGFSLTAIIQITTLGKDNAHPRWPDLAVVLFAAAAALLLLSLQFSAVGLGFDALPSERLEYHPGADRDQQILHKVRADQWEDTALRSAYFRRAGVCYNLGFLMFLAGIGSVLIPRGAWTGGRLVGLAIVAVAELLELVWAVTNASRPAFLLPTTGRGAPAMDPIADDGTELVFGPGGQDPDLHDVLAELVAVLRDLSISEEPAPQPRA